MSAIHYRDTCSRCIELEKQVGELRHELIARETDERQRLETLIEKLRHGEHGRFWTYQIKRRRWSGNWAGPGSEPPTKFLTYIVCLFSCIVAALIAEMALGFYPIWPWLAASALVIAGIELTIVKTPVYVNVNEGGGNTTTVH